VSRGKAYERVERFKSISVSGTTQIISTEVSISPGMEPCKDDLNPDKEKYPYAIRKLCAVRRSA